MICSTLSLISPSRSYPFSHVRFHTADTLQQCCAVGPGAEPSGAGRSALDCCCIITAYTSAWRLDTP
jgi:hypothetical protein